MNVLRNKNLSIHRGSTRFEGMRKSGKVMSGTGTHRQDSELGKWRDDGFWNSVVRNRNLPVHPKTVVYEAMRKPRVVLSETGHSCTS
jgi:hypothetical protein